MIKFVIVKQSCLNLWFTFTFQICIVYLRLRHLIKKIFNIISLIILIISLITLFCYRFGVCIPFIQFSVSGTILLILIVFLKSFLISAISSGFLKDLFNPPSRSLYVTLIDPTIGIRALVFLIKVLSPVAINMANKDPKGAYNRAPVFVGENYEYWKDCMSVHIMSIDMEVWNSIKNGRFNPTKVVDGVVQYKTEEEWTDDDKKKVQYDLKARNILISAIGVNEYYSISHCKTAKAMWDALMDLHEGTEDVKQSKINELTEEYECFHMEQGETIAAMQIRFIHLVNKLEMLGKTISNHDCANKILRSMNREWQPKVTAIKEAQNLRTLEITALFGKLKEHEREIIRLRESEEAPKRKEKSKENKSIALRASSSKANNLEQQESDTDDDSSNDEEMGLFVRRYNRYIRRNGLRHNDKNLMKFRKDSRRTSDNKKEEKVITCYECGKPGHIKSECPSLSKGKSKASYKPKGKPKGRRVYMAFESDEDESTSSSSSNEETAHLCKCLMARKHEEEVISDCDSDFSNNKPSYDELQNAFIEMHDEAIKTLRELRTQKRLVKALKEEISMLKNNVTIQTSALETLKDEHANIVNEQFDTYKSHPDFKYVSSCVHCPKLQEDIVLLKEKLVKANSKSVEFNMSPSDSRPPFRKPYAKYSYVKSNNRKYRKPYVYKVRCHYCSKIGHTTPNCNVLKFDVPKGLVKWVIKDSTKCTNSKGPNLGWGPNSLT